MWSRTKRVLLGLFVLTGTAVVVLVAEAWTGLGQVPVGERLERCEASPQYRDGQFRNVLPYLEDLWGAGSKWLEGGDAIRAPHSPLPVLKRTASEFATPPPSGLRITWLGHSSLLLEVGGAMILTDPVFGERSSPSRWLGPTRWYPPPLPLSELPPLDAVVISHDHFDHLDEHAVRGLPAGTRFVVPLGVGQHLEYWGVANDRIEELDWWDETDVAGVRVTCTPSRHFSGRTLLRDRTLWAGWAFASEAHRVFFSGDTGMFPGFAEIGERLGPFDVTMLEVGAYDSAWADIHLGPEQAVRAHQHLQGTLMIPVHWGMFDLALHGWTEPAERVLAAAEAAGVRVSTPRPGESIVWGEHEPNQRWWPKVPWQTASEHPVVSSQLPPGF